MKKPVIIELYTRKQNCDFDTKIMLRCYTEDDIRVAQQMIDACLYDLQQDAREGKEANHAE